MTRRWLWVAGAVAVALVASAGAVAAVVRRPPPPEQVVTRYLELLRARDAEAARAYLAVVPDLAGASDDLLVAEAMTGDWRVTQVVRRYHESDDPAIVDVTLTAADGTAGQGRFQLLRDGRSWTIQNPVVRVDRSWLPLTYTDFNGVVSDAAAVWLFPGTYRPYLGASGLVGLDVPTYVALPRPDARSDDGMRTQAYLPRLGLTDRFHDELHRQLDAWIKDCAARAEPYPAGCPFAAGNPGKREISVGRDDYSADEDTTVTWEVVESPQVRLQQANAAFTVQVVRPGRLHLSGTAVPLGGDQPEPFEGDCGVWLPGLRVTLGPTGEFTFHPSPWAGEFACTYRGLAGEI
ncbi:MAG TPA: hypothetical protein VIL37_08490 [Natronosporangium sp.]